jgi:hypothetical protein
MKLFNVMAFRLGSPTSTPVQPEFLHFYQYVAQSVMGEECRFIDPDNNPATIPFDNSLILRRPYQIYQRFIEYVQAWNKSPDVVVIDLTNNVDHAIDRGGVLMNIAQAIQYSIAEPVEHLIANKTIFTVLLPILPPEVDPIRQILQQYFESDRVVIISDDGRIFPPTINLGAPFSAQYRLSLATIREDPRIRARVKLIKRLGHFKRIGLGALHSSCIRYAYDGSLCVPELVELLRHRLGAEEFDQSLKPLMLYYGPTSHWLEDTVVAIGVEMELEYHTVEEITSDSFASDVLTKNAPSLLVVPMVDSGQTLKEALEKLAHLPNPIKPKVLSILTTQSTNNERRQRMIKIGTEIIVIEYMLQVAQKSYPKGSCPMCELDIPESSYDSDEFNMLTTYDMWDMADNAGWKAEDDVPSHRQAMPLVPDYPSLIEEHGAWLMSKVRRRLEELPAGFPADPLVICPDEKGSVVFTNYLTLVLKVTFVHVPRDVIDIAQLGEDALVAHVHEWEASPPPWYVQLSTISTKDIIVMDEFNVSGNTRKGLTSLLGHFGRQPLCYFSLVDFDPEHSRKQEVPTFSLYEFQAYEQTDPGNMASL